MDKISTTPSYFIGVNAETLSQMKNDLEAILENYLFELNNWQTHQKIEKNISSYFLNAWSNYPITHLSVSAISEHGVGVALQVGDTAITGNIGGNYQVDEFNVDFSITPEDLGGFGAFLKEWVDSIADTAEAQNYGLDVEESETVMLSVDDILFSAIKS